MSRTPRRLAGGRTPTISYKPIASDKDVIYNIEQLFQVAQRLSDNLIRVTAEQEKINKQMETLNKKIESLIP
jgi:hypothetical protein